MKLWDQPILQKFFFHKLNKKKGKTAAKIKHTHPVPPPVSGPQTVINQQFASPDFAFHSPHPPLPENQYQDAQFADTPPLQHHTHTATMPPPQQTPLHPNESEHHNDGFDHGQEMHHSPPSPPYINPPDGLSPTQINETAITHAGIVTTEAMSARTASLPPPPHNQQIGEGWLTVQSVFKSYKKRPVVRDVGLHVRRGEAVGLLGPNGAGKTTVFYMITGLVPADKGRIFIDGYDVTRLPMYRRSRLGIGYLPQEASIFRGLSVEDNIMAVLQIVEKNAKKRRYKLDSLLEEFNIERLRKSPSIALSGGERRRCEIARALASDPSYMLLDEPFAGIDPIAIGDIRELVNHLTKRGIGVLITDHNVRETLSMIDRAYIIHDGDVLMEGSPEEIIANDDVRRVYLGDMFNESAD